MVWFPHSVDGILWCWDRLLSQVRSATTCNLVQFSATNCKQLQPSEACSYTIYRSFRGAGNFSWPNGVKKSEKMRKHPQNPRQGCVSIERRKKPNLESFSLEPRLRADMGRTFPP